MEIKNEIEETFEKMNLEELKKVFDKDKDDLNDIFLKCQISEQEAINGCTKKIKFMQICENGKTEPTEMDVKIPKGIQKGQSIILYNQGNYIKELKKRSNMIIEIQIK